MTGSGENLSILTCAEVRAAETLASQRYCTLMDLMDRAGRAVAEEAERSFPLAEAIVVCGPGNNGGDGFAAAAALRRVGRRVRVFELAPGGSGSREREGARGAWLGPVEPIQAMDPGPGDVVIDALFGSGLSRPLSGPAADVVNQINASGAQVLAVDTPSGVPGDTGEVAGMAIRADATVTFDALKPAHVLEPAASLCGRIVVAPIGLEPVLGEVQDRPLSINVPAAWISAFPWPQVTTHKHQRGRLGVVCGPWHASGAARLAAQAGLRAGAGLVTVIARPKAAKAIAPALTAVMLKVAKGEDGFDHAIRTLSACVIGPGAGVNDRTLGQVTALARRQIKLVLDADALSVFAGKADDLVHVCAQSETVLTPHTGEFERVFPGVLKQSANKIGAARAAASQSGAVVVLKGPDTVIAAPDGRARLNRHSTPFLATAGTGDVLAGIIGALMAQGMSAFDAASAGVWLHSDAALRAGPGMTAEDLPYALLETLQALFEDG